MSTDDFLSIFGNFEKHVNDCKVCNKKYKKALKLIEEVKDHAFPEEKPNLLNITAKDYLK